MPGRAPAPGESSTARPYAQPSRPSSAHGVDGRGGVERAKRRMSLSGTIWPTGAVPRSARWQVPDKEVAFATTILLAAHRARRCGCLPGELRWCCVLSQAAFPGSNGKIAFVRNVTGDPFNPNFEVFTVKPADGTGLDQLTFTSGNELSPDWSSECSSLILHNCPSGICDCDTHGLARLPCRRVAEAQLGHRTVPRSRSSLTEVRVGAT